MLKIMLFQVHFDYSGKFLQVIMFGVLLWDQFFGLLWVQHKKPRGLFH